MNEDQPLNKDKIGGKTLRLFDLAKLGLNVPKFLSISANKLRENNIKGILNPKFLQEIREKISKELNCRFYAVRSSALVEDSAKSSFAGQFKTLINISKENLPQAIQEVATHAYNFLKGELEKFSIIVQEYIEPDYSGITFTRNPNGNREMLVEYHHGRGEEIVGGKIKPKHSEFYWNFSDKKQFARHELPNLTEAMESFKKIEEYYKFPQDIEWCTKNNTWYFLQARPITTILEKDYKQSIFLDKNLPENEKFYYEKTEISEIASRPTPITKDLLEEIYKTGGPIDLAYKKHKISYKARPILKIVGNELFIDREAELKTLLPSYSFLKNHNPQNSIIPTPKFATLKGLFTTFKNSFRLQLIKLNNYKELFSKLKNAIEEKNNFTQPQDFLPAFLAHYSLIFEINLLTKTAIDNLQRLIKKEQINIPELLNYYSFIRKEELDLSGIKLNDEHLIGNSLEVSDESEFTFAKIKNLKDPTVENWWDRLPSFKKTLLENPLKQAIIYNRLREINRWLVIQDIQILRNILLKIAQKQNFKDPKNIYFASLISLGKNKQPNETDCIRIKESYLEHSKFELPKTLIYAPISQNSAMSPIGLSQGIAEGTLISGEQLDKLNKKDHSLILYTKILSPELTKYFPRIKGIVSETGGLLSHLAIVARESKIPVIANFNLIQKDIHLGTIVKIDGGTGTIQKLSGT